MYHFVARAVGYSLLWRDAQEAAALWRILVRTFPELIALCLMPDHIHLLLPHPDTAGRLARAMAAYARWRNHHRRARGAVWERHPPGEHLPDEKHERRTVRYIHMNPCRARLVRDPAAWPWSTHRDWVGLAAFPDVERDAYPARFHQYVSADPSADVAGTALPTVRMDGNATWDEVHDTVCSLARTLPEELLRRGPARALAVKTAWMHGIRDADFLAKALGLHRARVYGLVRYLPARGSLLADQALAACVTAVGDARFMGFPCTRDPSWSRYRGR